MKERTAIEALRAGVPNRAAIRELGTSETELHDRFVEKHEECKAGLCDGQPAKGLIIDGRFGAGKSHLLGFMQALAAHSPRVDPRRASALIRRREAYPKAAFTGRVPSRAKSD